MLTLQYNQTGDRRPAFAKAVGEILGVKPEYTSVPKFAYIIDFVTVTRQGNIEVDEDISATVTCQGNIEVGEDISATLTRQGDIEVDEGPDKIESLIQKLMERGYSPLPSAPAQAITELQPVSMESANATIQSTSAAIPPAEQAQDCFSEGPAANSIQSTSATIQSAEQAQGYFSEGPAANSIQCTSATIPSTDQAQGCEINTAPEHPTDVEQQPQPFSDKDNNSTSEGISVTTISVPRDIFTDLALSNLQKLLWAKGELICQALDIASTDIEVTDETVSFPWFGELDADEIKYISQFINGLCEFANLSKRITSKRRKEGNPKFAMRTWTIRLGFKGPEYKDLRAYLLKRLPGDAAWRYGRPDSVARASING